MVDTPVMALSEIGAQHITNIFEGREFNGLLADAAEEVARILRRHCGPYAENAIATESLGSGREIDEYTKDGISIVNFLSSDRPEVEFVLRSVRYIGEKVDRACHDGTTTSMLFMALLISNVSHLLSSEEELSADRPRFARALTKTLLDLRPTLDESLITVDEIAQLAGRTSDADLAKVRYAVAYQQARISSKGNEDIARAVAEAISTIPAELYGLYTFKQASVERDEVVMVETQDHDFEFMSNLFHRDQYNHAAWSELLVENAQILFSANPLIRGAREEDAIFNLLTPDSEERPEFGLEVGVDYLTGPLVIFTPEIREQRIHTAINTWNLKHPEAQVYPMSIQVPDLTRKMYAAGLSATMGVKCLTDAPSEILSCISEPVTSLHQRGSYVRISGAYKKTSEPYHPFYLDGDIFPYYTKIREEIRALIDRSSTKHVESNVERNMEPIFLLYRMMVCQKIVDVRVCGATHDLIANLSVVEDAAGAAVSALSDGFITSGYQRWFLQMTPLPEAGDAHTHWARASVLNAIGDILQTTYRTHQYPVEPFADKFECDYAETDNAVIDRIQRKSLSVEDLASFIDDPHAHRILVQPIAGYYEQLKRINEVLPRIASSAILIDTSKSKRVMKG